MNRVAPFAIASLAALWAGVAVADEAPTPELSFDPPVVSDVPYPPLRPAHVVITPARVRSAETVRVALAPPATGKGACLGSDGAYDRACLARTFYLTMGGGF